MNLESEMMSRLRQSIVEVPYPVKPSVLRFVVKILRHRVSNHHLDVDYMGWANTSDVIAKINTEFGKHIYWNTFDHNALMALLDGNQERIEIGVNRIRARYGHSRPVFSGVAATPPSQLLHATPAKMASTILKIGLIPNGRTLVHLTTDLGYAQSVQTENSGAMKILQVDTSICLEVGCNFFQANDHVWQTLFVPPRAIHSRHIEDQTPRTTS